MIDFYPRLYLQSFSKYATYNVLGWYRSYQLLLIVVAAAILSVILAELLHIATFEVDLALFAVVAVIAAAVIRRHL